MTSRHACATIPSRKIRGKHLYLYLIPRQRTPDYHLVVQKTPVVVFINDAGRLHRGFSITSYLFPAILQIHWPRDREQGLFTAGTFSPWPICWAGKCLKSADHTSAGGDCSRVHPPCIFTPLSPGAITMVAVPRCVALRRVCVYRDRLTQSGVNCSLPSISWPLVGARRLSLWARWGLLQTTYSTHRISIRTSASRPGCVGFERRSILSLKRVVAKTQIITFRRKYKDSYYAPVQP